jgi:hypothetical protein
MQRRLSLLWSIGGVTACLCLIFSAPIYGSPDGRTFEMVSPVYKGGYGALSIEAVSSRGGAVVYYSPGAFAGSPSGLSLGDDQLDYLARRGAEGWTTTPLQPPPALLPYKEAPDIDPELRTVLVKGTLGSSIETADQLEPVQSFYTHATTAPDEAAFWEAVGVPMEAIDHIREESNYLMASEGFCKLLLTTPRAPLLSKASGTVLPLYEVTAGCNGELPTLRLVNVTNGAGGGAAISKECNTDPGVETYDSTFPNTTNAISNDGSEVFFTTCIGNVPTTHQLFVRLGGEHTLEVSQSLEEAHLCGRTAIPCPGASARASANFAGASTDGSRVYFTTTAQLTGKEADNGEKLYLARIGCAGGGECAASERTVVSLIEVSRNPGGGEAGVKGVVRTSPDGVRVYFMATGDLLTGSQRSTLEAAGEPAPVAGADNLYVYDAETGVTGFVAELCSGYELSGTAVDPRCQSRNGSDEDLIFTVRSTEAQTAGADGRFLVFASYAQLTSDDGDSARDVYRYDAETGVLTRVSGGEGGYDANGNNDNFGARLNAGQHGGKLRSQRELASRAISEDGTRIVFMAAEPLSPLVVNGLTNVYEWHETGPGAGSVALLSGGGGTLPVEDTAISPGGEDVFFVTSEGLAPEDVDGADDVYDARLGGGFPAKPAPAAECEGEGCYGALTNPAPLLVPGSAAQTPSEGPERSTVRKHAAARPGKARRKRSHRAKRRQTRTRRGLRR